MQPDLSRRSAIKYGASFLSGGSLVAWLGTNALAQKMTPKAELVAATYDKSTLTPDDALNKLMEGNKRFVQSKRLNPNQDTVRISETAEGQAPFAAILSCADSRVVPEIAFDQGIGDLFVVRIAGNIAMIEDIASEEFGVAVLGAPLLMVLGHQRCGAVEAALKGGELPGLIQSLVFAINPAVEASEGRPGDRLTNAIKANVTLQARRLKNSSLIAAAEKEGKVKVVGAYYDLDTGKVTLLS